MGKIKILILVFLTGKWIMNAQTIYLFPGQGSDERIFSGIPFDSAYKIVHIKYPIPEKGTSLPEFAKLLSGQIDTNEKYSFVGVSLGGMICVELSDYLNPEKIIILSSAKCSSELPGRYNFQKHIPLHKMVPPLLYRYGALMLQPIVEPDRKKHKKIFASMLKSKDKLYLKRTVAMIINWDRKTYNKNIVHIHGDNDHTIPSRNVKSDLLIKKGSHMMTLTRSEEIGKLISDILTGSEGSLILRKKTN